MSTRGSSADRLHRNLWGGAQGGSELLKHRTENRCAWSTTVWLPPLESWTDGRASLLLRPSMERDLGILRSKPFAFLTALVVSVFCPYIEPSVSVPSISPPSSVLWNNTE